MFTAKRALQDLGRIFNWIVEESPERARLTITRILAAVDGVLCTFPFSGRPTQNGDAIRSWPVRGLPYLVIYRPSADSSWLDVLNVVHAARNRDG